MTKIEEFKSKIRNRVKALEKQFLNFQKSIQNCCSPKEYDNVVESMKSLKFPLASEVSDHLTDQKMDVKSKLQIARYMKLCGIFNHVLKHYSKSGWMEYKVKKFEMISKYSWLGEFISREQEEYIRIDTKGVLSVVDKFQGNYHVFDRVLTRIEEGTLGQSYGTRLKMGVESIAKLTVKNQSISKFNHELSIQDLFKKGDILFE